MVVVSGTLSAALACLRIWDYVVVGGGTAGLAVASRLAEKSNLQILVLEAGTDQSTNPDISVAGNWATTFSKAQYNWGFTTVPQTHAASQTVDHPRGKLLGGSSAINAMEWTLASDAEYDAIGALGNSGWNAATFKKFLKKAQTRQAQTNTPLFPGAGLGAGATIGGSGPVTTSWNLWYSSLAVKFISAIQSLGLPINIAPEDGNASGVYNAARAVDDNDCTRQHAGVTYLKKSRSNLTVLTGVQATKILFAPQIFSSGDEQAIGVQFKADGHTFAVLVSKEVVLSAGTFMTPQILELSGIGKASVLKQFGIKQVMELPVGENLMDHLLINLQFTIKAEAQSQISLIPAPGVTETSKKNAATCSTGTPFLWSKMKDLTSSAAYNDLVNTLNGYLSSTSLTPLERAQFELQKSWLTATSGAKANVAEAEIIFAAFPGTPGLPLPDGTIGMWMPVSHSHPLSRGSVHIQSSDPLKLPKIDPNYLARDYDLKALRSIVKFTRTLASTGDLGAVVSGSILPTPDVQTDAQIDNFIKTTLGTMFHPVGTAAMMPKDKGGVVDSELTVYGTKNIRVVDASVIPMQFGATTMAAVYAIAERAACLMEPSIANC